MKKNINVFLTITIFIFFNTLTFYKHLGYSIKYDVERSSTTARW